ncbi:MAG TPA: hypothetical protein VGB37_14310 [Candidatus Lokiarchaeia archaeon]
MQNIQAKKENLIRLLGMVLILFGLLISIVLDYFIHSLILYVFVLLIFIPWFILVILLKLEIDFVVNKMVIFIVIIIAYSIVMLLIGNNLSTNAANSLIFITTVISSVLLAFSWNYAISIFKKKKLAFLIGGLGYCILTAIFRLIPLMSRLVWILSLTPLSIVLFGMILIFLAELRMRKKGLLNYV